VHINVFKISNRFEPKNTSVFKINLQCYETKHQINPQDAHTQNMKQRVNCAQQIKV